ncbi:uncharacterized protein METZ01_LOCUS37138 [marine metagenome]|uniref:DUF309 domain-containing protein n=1 Tax=marine metagenome TaxID=408172 RepID=A0A381QZ93_9ZZZZ
MPYRHPGPAHNTTVSSPCHESPPPLLVRGVKQFNRGDFFAQHETLEDLWNSERRPIRRLYQGILQVGVAMYQIQRCNHHGAISMLTRGPYYLRPFAPVCQEVDVKHLLIQAARVLSTVEELGPDRVNQFDWSLAPQVQWTKPRQRT